MSKQKQVEKEDNIEFYSGSRVSRKALKSWVHKARALRQVEVSRGLRSLGDVLLNEKLGRSYFSAQIEEIKKEVKERKNRNKNRKLSAVEKIERAIAG